MKKKIDNDPHKETLQENNKYLKNYQSLLTRKELDYFENFKVKTSKLYGLPKIHKSKTISDKFYRFEITPNRSWSVMSYSQTQ